MSANEARWHQAPLQQKTMLQRAEKRNNPGSGMVSRKCSRVHDAATSIGATRFFCQVPMVRAVTSLNVCGKVPHLRCVLLGKL